MSDSPASTDAVSDETLKAMLLDGLMNHPVSSVELLERICEGNFRSPCKDFPIGDDFLCMILRQLLSSDQGNQFNHIIEIFRRSSGERKPGKWVIHARRALGSLVQEDWYKPVLDAWTHNESKVQMNLELAFGLPKGKGRVIFKRALAARLCTSAIAQHRQYCFNHPDNKAVEISCLNSPELFESFVDMACSDRNAVKKAGIMALANYNDPMIEDIATDIILDDIENGKGTKSLYIVALCTLSQMNIQKGVDYFWGELTREFNDIDEDVALTVMALLLTRMAADARYRWLCATLYSSREVVRACAIMCTHLDPGEQWVEPLLGALAREKDNDEIQDMLLFRLKSLNDKRIGYFLAERLKRGFSSQEFIFLYDKYPEQLTQEMIMKALRNGDWESRQHAIETLGKLRDARWIPLLRKHCRDNDEDVRKAAIFELSKYDDPCVFYELVFTLFDTNENVRKRADNILGSIKGDMTVPFRSRDDDLSYQYGYWVDGFPCIEKMRRQGIDPQQEAYRLKDQIDHTFKWGERFGKAVLGCNTGIVRLVDGLGRTFMNWHNHNFAMIEVTLDPIVHQHKYGKQIVEALILHEIGHHLYDNLQTKGLRSVMGQVKAEGLDELFSILQDERLERRLRSCWPEYQAHIDRLNSYAFAEQTTDVPLNAYAEALGLHTMKLEGQIKSGQRAGVLSVFDEDKSGQQVTLKAVDLMALPGVMTPLQAFLLCLIGGFNPLLYHDPRLAEVMSLLPSNFKELDHADLLRVARSIRHLLDIPELDRQANKRRVRSTAHGRGRGESSPSPQCASALAEAMRQLLEWVKSLHISMQTVSSALNVPAEFLEAAAKGQPPSFGNADEDEPQLSVKGGNSSKLPGGKRLNLSKGADFDEIKIEAMLEFNSTAHAELVAPIRAHIRALRAYFELLGMQIAEESGMLQGRRLDAGRARLLPVTNNPNIMIRRYDAEMADAYIGIVIDKSGSMYGEEMVLAKSFATLISESARGIRGISGDVGAFDDDIYFHLGSLQRCSISSLEAGGGNNDAGGLARAAELALASGRKNKLLIMISDGSPTECTVEALSGLVRRLRHDYGIISVQVAVNNIEHEAFPDFVDLTAYEFNESVARFGQMVRQQTRHWH